MLKIIDAKTGQPAKNGHELAFILGSVFGMMIALVLDVISGSSASRRETTTITNRYTRIERHFWKPLFAGAVAGLALAAAIGWLWINVPL